MPIPREQFDKGLDETRYKIIKFLTANPEQAYDINEVGQEIYSVELPSDWKWAIPAAIGRALAIGNALDAIVHEGLVNKKVIGGNTYYSIHRG